MHRQLRPSDGSILPAEQRPTRWVVTGVTNSADGPMLTLSADDGASQTLRVGALQGERVEFAAMPHVLSGMRQQLRGDEETLFELLLAPIHRRGAGPHATLSTSDGPISVPAEGLVFELEESSATARATEPNFQALPHDTGVFLDDARAALRRVEELLRNPEMEGPAWLFGLFSELETDGVAQVVDALLSYRRHYPNASVVVQGRFPAVLQTRLQRANIEQLPPLPPNTPGLPVGLAGAVVGEQAVVTTWSGRAAFEPSPPGKHGLTLVLPPLAAEALRRYLALSLRAVPSTSALSILSRKRTPIVDALTGLSRAGITVDDARVRQLHLDRVEGFVAGNAQTGLEHSTPGRLSLTTARLLAETAQRGKTVSLRYGKVDDETESFLGTAQDTVPGLSVGRVLPDERHPNIEVTFVDDSYAVVKTLTDLDEWTGSGFLLGPSGVAALRAQMPSETSSPPEPLPREPVRRPVAVTLNGGADRSRLPGDTVPRTLRAATPEPVLYLSRKWHVTQMSVEAGQVLVHLDSAGSQPKTASWQGQLQGRIGWYQRKPYRLSELLSHRFNATKAELAIALDPVDETTVEAAPRRAFVEAPSAARVFVALRDRARISVRSSTGETHVFSDFRQGTFKLNPATQVPNESIRVPLKKLGMVQARLKGRELEGTFDIEPAADGWIRAKGLDRWGEPVVTVLHPSDVIGRYVRLFSAEFGESFPVDAFSYREALETRQQRMPALLFELARSGIVLADVLAEAGMGQPPPLEPHKHQLLLEARSVFANLVIDEP